MPLHRLGEIISMERPMDNPILILLESQEVREIMLSLIGGLITVLLALLAWIGDRMHNRLDEISKSLGSIDRDLRETISHIDRRVARLEGFHNRKDDD